MAKKLFHGNLTQSPAGEGALANTLDTIVGGFTQRKQDTTKEVLIRRKPENIDAEVWSVAVDIAVNDGRDKVTDADIDRAASILGLSKQPDGVYGSMRRRPEAPPEEIKAAPEVIGKPESKQEGTGDAGAASNVNDDTSSGRKAGSIPPPKGNDAGAAPLVDKLPEQKPYANILEGEDAGVDQLLDQFKASETTQTTETDLERRRREEEEERRKWEKYQNIADVLTALGAVASAANNQSGAGRFDIVSAQMFQGPGRMNLVQAGQGFRLGPYIRRG